MKKFIVIAAVACVAAAWAAFDVNTAKVIPAFGPTSISNGATNSVTMNVHSLVGRDALVVVANASAGRSLGVSLWATNSVDGGWKLYAGKTFSNTNACVVRVPFTGKYLPRDIKVEVSSHGGASVAGAFIEAF